MAFELGLPTSPNRIVMKFFKSLSIGTACALVACATGSAGAAETAPFSPPAHMAENWSLFADQVVTGRIRKVDPWKKHERFAPCVADANVCQLLAQHLLVLTVDVAKSGRGDVLWAVSVPDDQQPKIGQYIQFTLPTTAQELGAGVYDRAGKLVTQPCKWSKAEGDTQAREGVVCAKWNYSQLKFLADVPAQPAAAAASRP